MTQPELALDSIRSASAVPVDEFLPPPATESIKVAGGASCKVAGGASCPPEARIAASRSESRAGKYALVELVGQGGMGEVWKAWDVQLGRWVALKFLRVGGTELVTRFMREANALARLAHANITRVYEVGVHDCRPFLVMEFVSGQSLEKCHFDRRRAAEIVRDAARAVAFAHGQDVVHRDLKPANLLLRGDGHVFVTDFGLARLSGEASELTVAGALLGTPSYMAPEQAQGLDADQRSDIYSLGATLYALVEGRPPVSGETVSDVVRRVAFSPAPRLSGSDDLTVIVAKAMERDRQHRYAAAVELADDLDRYLADRPVNARPVGRLEQALRRAKRRPLVSSLVAFAVAAFLAGTLAGAHLLHQHRVRRDAERRASVVLSEAEVILGDIRRMESSNQRVDRVIERALEDLGKRSEAALEIAPHFVPALRMRAVYLAQSDRDAEAESILNRLLDADPQDHEARGLRARVRFRLADVPTPTTIATRKGIEFVHHPPPVESEAMLRLAAGDYALIPTSHPDYALGQARLAYARGDYATARDLLRRCLEDRPYLSDARTLLAWSELSTSDFAAAEKNAGELIERGLVAGSAHAIRAFARAGQGKLADAVEDAGGSLERHPDWAPQRRFRAFWLSQLGRHAEALADYDLLIERDPENADHLTARAMARLAAQDRAGALEDAERAVRLAPENAEAHYYRGLALGTPRGVEALSRAIELDPTHVAAIGQRGIMYVMEERYAEAERDLRQAIELDAGYGGWHFVLAVTLGSQERYGEAEEVLNRAFETGFKRASVLHERAVARAAMGRCREALEDLAAAAAAGDPGISSNAEQVRQMCDGSGKAG